MSLIYIYNVLLVAFHDVRLDFLSVVKENEVQSRFAPGMIIILPAVLGPSQSEDSALTGLDDHLQLWTAQAPHDPLSHSIINFLGSLGSSILSYLKIPNAKRKSARAVVGSESRRGVAFNVAVQSQVLLY